MNTRKQINIQGDRELNALSEYIIGFLKKQVYRDEKLKKQICFYAKKIDTWESEHGGAFIVLNFLW